MSGGWIALIAVLVAAAAAAFALAWRRLRPTLALIRDLSDETTVDRRTGAVRSIQRADVLIEPAALEEMWTPAHLERLARTYWRFLTRVTLGLIQVRYTATTRSVVLLFSPLRLLTFAAPEYEAGADRGLVRWRIARGLLAAKHGHDGSGYLQIEVRRVPCDEPDLARLHVEVAVANFYPSIASGLSLRVYNATQSRLHVMITYGFLRSLARLDLAESRVGLLAPR